MNTRLATPAATLMHPDERATRQRLAACYRIFAMLGWTEMIYNHITLRLPDSVTGGEKQFLINPFGLHYTEVTASNLVKINLAGDVLDGSTHPVNPAGYTLHSTIHGGIDGAHCVMHTHTTAGVAVASLQGGLSQSNFYSAQLHDMVAYHAFEGITIHAEEGPRVLASIGTKPAVILRNHGLLAWGQTLEQTVPEAIAQKCTRDALQFDPRHGAGKDVFNALVRQVDRIDISYQN